MTEQERKQRRKEYMHQYFTEHPEKFDHGRKKPKLVEKHVCTPACFTRWGFCIQARNIRRRIECKENYRWLAA